MLPEYETALRVGLDRYFAGSSISEAELLSHNVPDSNLGEFDLVLSFDLDLNLLAAPNAFVPLEHLRGDLFGDFHCFPLLLLLGLQIAQLLRLPPGLNDQLADELNRDPKFPGHLDLAQALDHVAMDDVNDLVR